VQHSANRCSDLFQSDEGDCKRQQSNRSCDATRKEVRILSQDLNFSEGVWPFGCRIGEYTAYERTVGNKRTDMKRKGATHATVLATAQTVGMTASISAIFVGSEIYSSQISKVQMRNGSMYLVNDGFRHPLPHVRQCSKRLYQGEIPIFPLQAP
jgi:hypothetical protein